jgi:hypothetical protein
MCEQQFQAEVMDELKQQEIKAADMLKYFNYVYNTNVGTKGEDSVTTFIFGRRSSSKDGQVY